MFKDENLEAVTIKSDVKEDKYVRDQLCQTVAVSCDNRSCQTIDRHNVDVQTDFEQKLPQSTRLQIDTSKNLATFLLNVYPNISKQLIANIRSHAFDGYDVDWNENVEKTDTLNCIHTFKNTEVTTEQNVTSLSWNSTGSVIAATLGSFEHESWCVHQSFVYLWNIDRFNINANKPDKIIDSDTCLMSIAFHPEQPALLVGGDFSGKVYIWDMSEEDNMLIAYSGKEIISHQEPITKVVWTKSSRSYGLVSVGCDGKILIWEFNQLKRELKINKQFLLQSNVIPRRLRHNNVKNDLEIGITCMTLSSVSEDILFIGTETGAIFKCFLDSRSPLLKTLTIGNESFLSPQMQTFEGHLVTVNSIHASPHFEKIFLSCASDMTVHIYNTDQTKPIIIIEPVLEYLLNIQWSPTRPTVFYISTLSGSMHIFDLTVSSFAPVKTVSVQENNKGVYALSFNRHNIIATGDADGTLKIWSLPSQFVQEKNGENNYFGAIESFE